MGILLKDGLFVDLEKGRRICIFTNTCERRTKPRSAGFYFHLCLATSSSFFDSAPSRSFPWLPASPHRRREAPSSASPRHREDHRLAVIGRAQAASSATACLCPFVSLALSPAAPWSQLSVQVCGANELGRAGQRGPRLPAPWSPELALSNKVLSPRGPQCPAAPALRRSSSHTQSIGSPVPPAPGAGPFREPSRDVRCPDPQEPGQRDGKHS